MKERYFITGIGTEVGKTIASAIVTEALKADYWKPIQAGDLDNSDTHKVQSLISNQKSFFHQNSFALKTPMSPHAAAEIDGVDVTSGKITEPETDNHLIIEGAGGLLVPINKRETILDLIKPSYKVILVSRHYLGSINHTLMSMEILKQRGHKCFGIIFSGNEHPTTEGIIKEMTGVPVLARISEEMEFKKETILKYAREIRGSLVI